MSIQIEHLLCPRFTSMQQEGSPCHWPTLLLPSHLSCPGGRLRARPMILSLWHCGNVWASNLLKFSQTFDITYHFWWHLVMICHDISFASIVFWLFARLSCRALLLNGAFSPESKDIATVWFQSSCSMQVEYHLWANSAGARWWSRKKLTSCRLQWVWSCLRWNPLKQGWALAMRLSYSIQSAVKYVGHTTPRGHAAHFYLKSALSKKPLELRLASCENIIISELFQDLHNLTELASCVLPVPVGE